ncbi:Long chain acyl-CoA synthetase 7 peroxisomal [Aphanomyces cochlioides]|nr:Long chain acyl-CoA synthetase 7 peroxisomal [Aphanomyces cochlioides]
MTNTSARELAVRTEKAGPYTWMTYNQANERIGRIATGLQERLQLKRQEVVGIFSKNRSEWILTEHACSRMAYILVPFYDTLGSTAIPYIINHTEMRVLVCSNDLVSKVLEAKASGCPSLKVVISMEAVTREQISQASCVGVALLSLREVESVPEATGRSFLRPFSLLDPLIVPPSPPEPSDLATICYTSGTTGNPKGVMLTHGNLTSAIVHGSTRNPMQAYWVHLSYLPLAHVMERMTCVAITQAEGSIGFYQGDILHLLDDVQELQPHVFLSAPRLYNRVYDKIMHGINNAGSTTKLLFDNAFATKKQNLAHGILTHAVWDALVFKRIRAILGGRVQVLYSDSAPLSANVKEFFKIAFSCRLEEGYGLTKTSAAATSTMEGLPSGTHVGIPKPTLQIRLRDVPDMNYTSADNPRPRGEIYIRGPSVFIGYYKDDATTAQVLSSDGWFATGDIGAWNADGTLSIIDRKKNIFKLSQGEYVAVEKIENIYVKSPLVAQIFVYGDSYQSFLVGVVVPDPDAVQSWAQQKKISGDLKSLLSRGELKAAIMASMTEMADEARLLGFERVKDIHLHPEAFSADKDMITPTFKLKRPQLKAYFQGEIAVMYANYAPAS